MNIGIDVKNMEDSVLVYVKGEVDAYTAPKLKDQVASLTDTEEVNLVVDLSGVSYMDSTGLGVFIGLLKNIRKQNGTLKLVGLNDRLQRLFNITGLADIMDVNSKVEGGVK